MDIQNRAVIVPDMPNADYHAHPAISSSGLKELARSPLHYWAKYRDPNREPPKRKETFRTGTAWHAAMFEPHLFEANYIILPEGIDRRTKEGKALWAEVEESGREPLKPAEHTKLLRMAAASRANPVSAVLFEQNQGAAEVSIFWTDPETGVQCKIRPDYAIAPCEMFPHGLILDGKTAEDASPAGFARAVWNYRMFVQSALYADGFQIAHGTDEPPAFLWLAQEKETPFATAYYSAGADVMAFGRREYRRLLQIASACLATDNWPGYPAAVRDVSMPAWAQKEMADALAN